MQDVTGTKKEINLLAQILIVSLRIEVELSKRCVRVEAI